MERNTVLRLQHNRDSSSQTKQCRVQMTSEHKRRHKVTMPRINTIKKTKKYHAYKNPKFRDNKWQKYYGTKEWHKYMETIQKVLERSKLEL